jgi:hypothetical protein
MDDKTLKRGYRNGWLLALLLLLLVIAWTAFTIWTNLDEVPPHFVQGGREFTPAASEYGVDYTNPANAEGDQPE